MLTIVTSFQIHSLGDHVETLNLILHYRSKWKSREHQNECGKSQRSSAVWC